MALRQVVRASSLLIGQCHPSLVRDTARVIVSRLVLDDYFMVHIPEKEVFYAYDPKNQCKPGDVVLIEQLPERKTKKITHQVKEVIFPCGDIVDPVSGRRTVGNQYRDLMEYREELYRKLTDSSQGFDYSSAPPRGSTDKDKTYRETYQKYDARIKDDYAV